MRYWPAIALGLGVVALVALVLPLVQSQRHLSGSACGAWQDK